MANYPASLPGLATNHANETAAKDTHPAAHNQAADEINAIAAELGTAPAGSEATVKARLAAIEDAHGKGAFSAARLGALSLNSGAVVVFDTDSGGSGRWFDTESWYDTSNGRFTPQRAGIYRFSWMLGANIVSSGQALWTTLQRNGSSSLELPGSVLYATSTNQTIYSRGGVLVQANGLSDYFQIVIYTTSSSQPRAIHVSEGWCYFQGELVRPT